MKLAMICAVAALMAAALSFPATADCRGCVVETPAATTTLASADASALPIAGPKCHMREAVVLEERAQEASSGR